MWWEELTHWKRPWCWERLKAGGEGNDRGRGGWKASLTQQQTPGDGEGQGRLTCCSSWGHRVRHDWVTEQQPISSFLAYVWRHWIITLNHKSWYDGLIWNSCY